MRRLAARGLAAVLVAATAGSCAPRRADTPALVTRPATPALCQVGPDGGPVDAVVRPGQTVAERGIGGTGAPGRLATQVAERGIGGTGIIGVITGFGSVCVNGEEVALAASVPVSVDTASATPAVLRAGQLVALEAGGPDGGTLAARSVQVRHEVSGPVETVDPGRLRVAGQDVVVTADTWGTSAARRPGDWVEVSGLRRPDGTIEATRIDPRLPGPVLVHGTLRVEGGRLRIGQLVLAANPAAVTPVDSEVTASGILLGAELNVTTLEPDRLAIDPGTYFGPGVTTLLVEGFVSTDGGGLRLGRAALAAGRGFDAAPGRAVVTFSRTGPGRFEAVGGREPGIGGRERAFIPAPGARGGVGGFGNGFGERGARDRFGGAGRSERRGDDRGAGQGPGAGQGSGPGQAGPGLGGGFGGGSGFGGSDAGGFDGGGDRRRPGR